MGLRGLVEKRLAMQVITIWVKVVLWWSLIRMLRNLILLCPYRSGVLVKCLNYSTVHLLRLDISFTPISKSVSSLHVASLTHLEAFVYLMVGWMTNYIRKVMPIFLRGLLPTSFKVQH